MKKILAILCVLSLLSVLVACGQNRTPTPTDGTPSPGTPGTTPAETETPPAPTETGKTLVVYFSATGNTGRVAEWIAQEADGMLFELVPVNPYTDADLNWTVSESRVNREHEDLSLRNIELKNTVPENWESYDTVYLGYPIWWGIAAWPVDAFLKSNDFTGKTVIPFCTATSSGLGESGELLAEMAGKGNWQTGKRFSSGVGEKEVSDWVKEQQNQDR